jgi:hypothetical protein
MAANMIRRFVLCQLHAATIHRTSCSIASRSQWRTMDDELSEHEFRIWIDRRENTSVADVRDTLQHEACHIQVDWKEPEEHGPAFQECMKRFP